MERTVKYDPRFKKHRVFMYALYVGILAHLVGGITWAVIRYIYIDNP